MMRNNLLILHLKFVCRLSENDFYNKLSFHFSVSLLLSFVSLHIAIWFLINSSLLKKTYLRKTIFSWKISTNLSSSLATAVKSLFMRSPIPFKIMGLLGLEMRSQNEDWLDQNFCISPQGGLNVPFFLLSYSMNNQ